MSKIRDENINFKYNLKIYLSLLKKYKWAAILLFVFLFIVEASLTIERYLFKILIDKGTDFINKLISIDEVIKVFILVGIVFVTLMIIGAILEFFNLHLLNRLEANMIRDLKRKYFNHIVHLSHGFHTSHKTGSLISRLGRGGHSVERLTDVIIYNFSPLVFQLIIVTGSLIYFNFYSAITIILTTILFTSYSIIIQNKQRKYNIIMNDSEDFEKAYVSDVMTNVDSIKYYGKENVIKNKFKTYSQKTRDATLKFVDYFRVLGGGQSLILGIGLFFLIYFPLVEFLDGNLSLGSIVFIYTLYGNVAGPLYRFVHGIRGYYRSMADFEALFKYGKIENEIKDLPNAKELKIKNGNIEFKDITFKYGKRTVFSNFNLKINKDEKVALVGQSGCGKTTLIKLLYRLYNLDDGEILIDNKNINQFKQESLRSELSIVPQECILFDDTVYNNIAFSKPNAKREEVMKAMKLAQLDRIINEFPKKEKTIVGERGVKLSGGEKQRVSIARAILSDKDILVLDEATSSLDSETEHEIQIALQNLMKNRTSIIIAHRLSTIMNADKIVVMDKGKIVQSGKHRNLLRSKGLYKRLWNLQRGGYIK